MRTLRLFVVLRALVGAAAILSFALSLGVTASADQGSELVWKTVKSRGGVKVEQAKIVDSPIKVTRGSMISNARMFDVLAVLQDVESCQRWLHKCKEGRVIGNPAFNEAINYTVIDSPLMLKDRDSYIHSTVSYDPAKQLMRINMVGVEETAPLVEKRVRMLNFQGHWLIEQLTDDTTQLSYQAHMDPQVAAAGAANSTLATSVLETLRNVDRLARKAPYVNSVVPEQLLDGSAVLPDTVGSN